MHRPRTTICCSALALSLALTGTPSSPIDAQSLPKNTPRTPRRTAPRSAPLSLFPTETVWTLELHNHLTAAPAHDEKRAYFPIEGGRLAAYRLETGAQDWLVMSGSQMEPAIGDGLIFLVAASTLTALHVDTGTAAWQLPLTEKLAVHPVWDNGWLVAATATGTVLAFRAQDGFLIWRHELGSPAHGVPALAADRVYVPTEDGRIVALRVDTGTAVWERKLGGPPNDILALDDRVYAGSRDNFFYCLDAKDGRVDWRWRTGGDVIGQPVVGEDSVYFVSLDNVLRALARKNGSQRWMRPLPLRPTSGPILSNGTLLVGGGAPNLHGYTVKDGTSAGDVTTTSNLAAPPQFIAGMLPRLLMVTSDIAKGATATLLTRAIEPAATPIAPLLNPVPVGVTEPETDEPR